MKKVLIAIGLITAAALVTAGCSSEKAAVRDAKAAEVRTETYVIPAGTSVVATLDARLSTENGNSGDHFTMSTVDAVISAGRSAMPAGSVISGTLADVQASGRTAGRAQMTLTYTDITNKDGKSYPLSAETLSLRADSGTGTDVERMAAGGILGALVGGVAGGGKGAAIGAGAGVGAGAIVMLATQGDEVVIEAGQKVNIVLTSPLTVTLAAR